MTIVLILQLSESSRSRVSLLHSAQCNVFVFVFVYLSFFPFCFCLGRRSSLERLLSNSRVAFDHQNRHHPGVEPSPCFSNFLARTTFILVSLPEAKNPGQDAFLGILSLTVVILDIKAYSLS